jgi:hypothetical protein
LIVLKEKPGPIDFSYPFPYDGSTMPNRKTDKPMPRARVREALQSVPLHTVLGEAHRALTPKQRKFALEVAKGSTKADAYRSAYNVNSSATLTSNPYHLAADSRIRAEIEAIELAMRAQEYQTPTALRQLVIHSLVKVITDPDSKPGQITAAAKVLGTVTEVAAFTERKEIRRVSDSESARTAILDELKALMKHDATDVDAVDISADSLLAELESAGRTADTPDETTEPGADPHRTPTPPFDAPPDDLYKHTIPHDGYPHFSQTTKTADSDSSEDPPLPLLAGTPTGECKNFGVQSVKGDT